MLDDRESNRQVVSTLLTSWGCRISAAADAASALALLHEAAGDGDPFALALVDKEMPGEDGEDTARQISADPRLVGTRLLLMTPLDEDASHGSPASPNRSWRRACTKLLQRPWAETPLRRQLPGRKRRQRRFPTA